MNFKERKELLDNRAGEFEFYNLWHFWDSISTDNQNEILYYFENTPLMWDYKSLFKSQANSWGRLWHGDIYSLSKLLVIDDLEFADQCFLKFTEYKESNYHEASKWGMGWEEGKNQDIMIWERIVSNSESSDLPRQSKVLEARKKVLITDVYWLNAYFFVQEYSSIVYKHFLKGNCDIDRFKQAFLFCYNNIVRIQEAFMKDDRWDKLPGSKIIEQYLIYLEKQHDYISCIEIILSIKDNGWNNDFEKRLSRCYIKLNKKDQIK